MPFETEFYDILEVTYTASLEDIKKSYRKKALIYHPDKGGNEDSFKKLNIAYEVLSNQEKRELYDKFGKTFKPSENMFSNVFGNMNNITNIFNMFNNNNNKTKPVIHTYDVSIEDICNRKVVKLKVDRDRLCSCIVNNSVICNFCKGSGNIVRNFGFAIDTCGNCKGEGKFYHYCQNCNKGLIISSKIFELHLNPEVENGFKYIFKNEGNHYKKLEPGDFIVNISYLKHPEYEVEKKDLICNKTISLKDALCGFDINIKHPSGEILNHRQKEIVYPGYILTIPSKGLSYGGNMKIVFTIQFPKELSEEQLGLIKKL